jgi:hypothetical protein
MEGLGIAVAFVDYPGRSTAVVPIDKQVVILLPNGVERCSGVSNRSSIDMLRCLLQQRNCIPSQRVGEKTASSIANDSGLVLQGSEAEVERVIADSRIPHGVIDKGCTPLPLSKGTVGFCQVGHDEQAQGSQMRPSFLFGARRRSVEVLHTIANVARAHCGARRSMEGLDLVWHGGRRF